MCAREREREKERDRERELEILKSIYTGRFPFIRKEGPKASSSRSFVGSTQILWNEAMKLSNRGVH